MVAELTSGLNKHHGPQLERGDGGGLVHGGREVAAVEAWEPGERIVLRWRRAGWQPELDVRTEFAFEATRAGTRVSIRHTTWDAMVAGAMGVDEEIGGWQEALGWFTGEVAAPFVASVSPSSFGEWVTDRAARRPTGLLAQAVYADPTEHQSGWEHVLDALRPGADDRLLEIGCGGGGLLDWALRTGCRAAGVDHSQDMLALASERNAEAVRDGRLDLVQADAAELPFEDGTFTAVAMANVFAHLPDPVAVLRECRRVLDPAGRLAVATISERLRGTPATPEPMASILGFYSTGELAAFARTAGFAHANAAEDGTGWELLVAR